MELATALGAAVGVLRHGYQTGNEGGKRIWCQSGVAYVISGQSHVTVFQASVRLPVQSLRRRHPAPAAPRPDGHRPSALAVVCNAIAFEQRIIRHCCPHSEIRRRICMVMWLHKCHSWHERGGSALMKSRGGDFNDVAQRHMLSSGTGTPAFADSLIYKTRLMVMETNADSRFPRRN